MFVSLKTIVLMLPNCVLFITKTKSRLKNYIVHIVYDEANDK